MVISESDYPLAKIDYDVFYVRYIDSGDIEGQAFVYVRVDGNSTIHNIGGALKDMIGSTKEPTVQSFVYVAKESRPEVILRSARNVGILRGALPDEGIVAVEHVW